jgi:hypothetical protein
MKWRSMEITRESSLSRATGVTAPRQLPSFCAPWVLVAGLLMTTPVSSEKLVELNYDSRTAVALRVGSAAVQKWLPPGWEVDPVPSGPLKDSNILLMFTNPWLTQNAEGKSTSVPIERRLLILATAKSKHTGESTILVLRSYDANGAGLPGSYKSSVAATLHLVQTLKGTGVDPATGTESWEVHSEGGVIELRLQYQRGVAMRLKQEARPRSAIDPTIVRIYRADQGLDVVRSVPAGIDRVQAYSLRVTLPELRELFDGGEQLIAIALPLVFKVDLAARLSVVGSRPTICRHCSRRP